MILHKILIPMFFLLLSFGVKYNLTAQVIPVQLYRIEDGLSTNYIFDVIQDKSGRMWFATEKGLSVYDSYNWINYNNEKISDLPKHKKLRYASDGSLWLLSSGTINTISEVQNGLISLFTKITYAKQYHFIYSFDIIIGKGMPILCVGTNAGILSFKDGHWDNPETNRELYSGKVNSVTAWNKKFYCASDTGVFTYDPSTLKIDWSISNKIDKSIGRILSIDLDKTTPTKSNIPDIWLLGTNGIGNLSGERFHFYPFNTFYKNYELQSRYFIESDGIDKVYFGNEYEKNVFDIEELKSTPLQEKNGFSGSGALAAFSDLEKNIWFVSSRGVEKATKYIFENYNQASGLLENEVSAIIETADKELLIGHNQGFTILRKGKLTTKNHSDLVKSGVYSTRILKFIKDKNGVIWIAGSELGIGQYINENQIKWIRPKPGESISALAFLQNGILIVGSNRGFYSFNNDSLERIDLGIETSRIYVRDIYVDHLGKVFGSTNIGLIIFDFKKGKGKFNTKYYPQTDQYALFKYNENEFLVGAEGGLFIFREDKIEKFISGNFSIDKKVFSITKDHKNNFWFGTDDGIIKWDGQSSSTFTTESGLLGRETNRGALYIDSNGILWVGTEKGLSKFESKRKFSQFPIHLELHHAEDLRGTNYLLNKKMVFPSSQNSLVFVFQGISFRSEKKIEYRVMLSGFDDDWINIGKQTSIRYTNLPPGDYKLYVQSKIPYGLWSNSSISASIIIERPLSQQWWFYLAVVAGLMVITRLTFNYYARGKYTGLLSREVELRTTRLKESEDRIRTILDNAPSLIISFDRSGQILYKGNTQTIFLKNFSYDKPIFEIFDEPFRNKFPEIIKIVFDQNQMIKEEISITNTNNDETYLELIFSPVKHGTMTDEAIVLINDISHRKKTEALIQKLNECLVSFSVDPVENINKLVKLLGEQLNASATLYNCISDHNLYSLGTWNTPQDYASLDKPEGRICFDLINSKTDEILIIRQLDKTGYFESDPNVKKYNLKTYIGIPVPLFEGKRGSLCAVFKYDKTLSANEKEFISIIRAALIVEDDRRRAEILLKDSLNEKEVLLKEVHHRVKNNLQIISSLLSLQSENIFDEDLKVAFRESYFRVRTMALVHEKLYQSNSLSSINFEDYVKELISQLIKIYNPKATIKSVVNIQSIFLPVDIAIPCGLIINEVVSNSLKYAFPADKDIHNPIINIECTRKENEICIILADNGIGLPEGMKIDDEQTSFGINLILSLVKQLHGQLFLERTNGSKFNITFQA